MQILISFQTEQQIIDEIQSLGDEILNFQEEISLRQIKKDQINEIINQNNRSVEKYIKVQKKGSISLKVKSYLNYKMSYTEQNNQKKQTKKIVKVTEKKAQQYIIKPKKQLINPKKIENNKQKNIINKSIQIQVQEKQIALSSSSQYNQANQQNNTKNKQSKMNKKLQELNKQKQHKQKQHRSTYLTSRQAQNTNRKYQSSSNYFKRFIDRNMQKVVKQQRQILQDKTKQIFGSKQKKDFAKTQQNRNINKNEQKFSLATSRQKLDQSFQVLYTNSKTLLQRKQQKIDKIREQNFKKEMENVTFQPVTFTEHYKSNNSFIKQTKNLQNFYQRLRMSNQIRNKNQMKQIAQVMQQCSFQPRLNLNSKQAKSIVKEIWKSQEKQVKKFKVQNNRSLQKFNHSSFYVSERNSILSSSMDIPVHNPHQLSFLLR